MYKRLSQEKPKKAPAKGNPTEEKRKECKVKHEQQQQQSKSLGALAFFVALARNWKVLRTNGHSLDWTGLDWTNETKY